MPAEQAVRRNRIARVPSPSAVADGLHETDALLAALATFRDTYERRESLRLLRAVRLAPSLEVCEAILRRERVPKSRLDPLWTERYGL